MAGEKIKANTATFLEVYLYSNTTYEPVASATYSQVTFAYAKNVDPVVAFTEWPLSAANFHEVGSGFYKVEAASTLFDTYGSFHYTAYGTGYSQYHNNYTVAHKPEYQTDFQVVMSEGSFSVGFTPAWLMKVIGSLHFANYAEVNRTFDGSGLLTSSTIHCYDFTDTASAASGTSANTIATLSVSVGYTGGVRTRFSGWINNPSYTE